MPAYKSGEEIRKLIEEIRKAQVETWTVTFTFKLTIAFEELDALTTYIDDFIADRFKQKYPGRPKRSASFSTPWKRLPRPCQSRAGK